MANVEEGKGGFDPFAKNLERKESMTDGQTLTHLLKAALGSGILSMPIAFYFTGLFLGVICFIITGLVCGHAAYVLVKCAHRIYYAEQTTDLTFADLSERVFKRGPKWVQAMGPCVKFSVIWLLFLTYFGTCSVYTVFVAANMQQIIEQMAGTYINLRVLVAALLIPSILLVWIPNLKSLAPISLVANVFVAAAIIITCYYIFKDIGPISDRVYFKFDDVPAFFAITIFAVECIGVILPLANNMKRPPNFLGYCGVMVRGMLAVCFVTMMLGFLGYWRYGPDTKEAIPLNLPVDEIPAQLVKLLISLAMFGTFGLQFTVCLEITWNAVRGNCLSDTVFHNYIVRTLLCMAAIGIAVAVPSIAPFMGLIGAFCFSILGIIMPVVFEIILDLETGFGPGAWLLWKNVAVIGFGIFALIFGTKSSLQEISKLYY